jgi:large subunit ribosomal protein L10
MREAGATYKVSKNKLAKIALQDTDYAGISDLLTGPVGLATSTDPVAAAKVVAEFAKTNDKLEIVGGGMGATVLDKAGVTALASLPSLDELRAKIVGLVQAPATKLAQLTNAPASKLARVFAAYGDKDAA